VRSIRKLDQYPHETGIHCTIRRVYPDGMVPTNPSPSPPEPGRFPLRLPHWGWFLLATVVLVVGYVGTSVWLPYHREQQAIRMIESWGCIVKTATAGPEWLRWFVGDDRMKDFKVFDRVCCVELSNTEISDAGLAHLSGLTYIQVLQLNGTAVTDAGLAHLSRLTNLRTLYLHGTAITDKSLIFLTGMRQLGVIDLRATQVTAKGVEELKITLPDCKVAY
jgi:hypothetical protein